MKQEIVAPTPQALVHALVMLLPLIQQYLGNLLFPWCCDYILCSQHAEPCAARLGSWNSRVYEYLP